MIQRLIPLAVAALLAACATGPQSGPAPGAGPTSQITRIEGAAIGGAVLEPGSEMTVTVYDAADSGVPIARSVLGEAPPALPWPFALPVPTAAMASVREPVVSVTIKNQLGLLAFVSNDAVPYEGGRVSVPVVPAGF